MEQQQHQQQQQDAVAVHRSILDPIMSLRQRRDAADNDDNEMPQQQQHEEEEPLSRLMIGHFERVNRHSVQYLVDFLREDSSHPVRELDLNWFSLLNALDGSLDILIDFFANDTNLTKVVLADCSFGSAEGALRFFAAFHNTNNTAVTHLDIFSFLGLEGAALGACISDLLRNSNLQRISCAECRLQDAGISALQPGLEENHHLKELSLYDCEFGDGGVRLLVDSLVGNTTLEILDLGVNRLLTPLSLAHITRLLESAQLKEIKVRGNGEVLFGDEDAVQHFARTLSRNQFLKSLDVKGSLLTFTPGRAVANIFQALEHNATLEQVDFGSIRPSQQRHLIDQVIASLPRMKGLRRLHFQQWEFLLQSDSFVPALQHNTSLEEFLHTDGTSRRVDVDQYPQHRDRVVAVMNILARNRSLNRAKALLALQPQTRVPIKSKSGVWYKAMAKLGQSRRPEASSAKKGSPGASSIFHILQARPALLERQLLLPQQQGARRPLPPAQQQASSRRRSAIQEEQASPGDDDNSNSDRKRARLS